MNPRNTAPDLPVMRGADTKWATFLRVAYLAYVVTLVWRAGLLVLLSDYDIADSDLLFIAGEGLQVAIVVLLLILVLQFNYLPRTVRGMLHLFLPLLFLIVNALFGIEQAAVVEVAIIHLGAALLAYPLWLYSSLVRHAKGPLFARWMNFLVQFLFMLYAASTAIVLILYYVEFWLRQVEGGGAEQWQMLVSTILLIVFTADQLHMYLKGVKQSKSEQKRVQEVEKQIAG